MPRQPRLDAPGILHHVIGRGIEKRNIFNDNRDRTDFINRLASLAIDGSMDIYAWALLPHHFHLLCKTKTRPLANSMRILLTGYVVNFNRRYKRHGHLFQNRYKSIVCQEDRYLRELVRYIHLNLIRAKLVNNIRELNRSLWSGHSVLMGYVRRDWQNTEYVLAFFGDGEVGRRNYFRFVEEGIYQGNKPELVGGGLIRSLGGWSEVLALRRHGGKEASDQRILGDSEFVEGVLSNVDNSENDKLRLKSGKIDLGSLATNVCRVHGVTVNELRSGSRRHEIAEARRVLSWLAVKEFGYSGAEVALYLGVTNSCVTRTVSRGNRPKIERYI